MVGWFFLQQFFPGTFIGGEAMNRGLYLVTGSTEVDPNHALARLLSAVENSDHIARA
jgi:hypothetical protein